MKRVRFTMLMLLIAFQIKGQSLVEEGKIWSIARFPTIGKYYYTYFLKIEGDTIANNQKYKKLYCSSDSLMMKWEMHSLMRQDSGLVLVYDEFSKQEEVLYNFNLAVGDSFISSIACKFIVDSIKVKNELKYFYLSAKINHQLVWIENIGCVDGLLVNTGKCDIVGDSSILLCCNFQNSLLYKNSNYKACYIQYTGIDDEKINRFQLSQNFPNPFNSTTQINIELEKVPVSCFLNIFSLEGRLLKCIKILQLKNEVKLESAEFKSKGVYFYNLTLEGEASKMKKLLVY